VTTKTPRAPRYPKIGRRAPEISCELETASLASPPVATGDNHQPEEFSSDREIHERQGDESGSVCSRGSSGVFGEVGRRAELGRGQLDAVHDGEKVGVSSVADALARLSTIIGKHPRQTFTVQFPEDGRPAAYADGRFDPLET